jgi:hypothetical protein
MSCSSGLNSSWLDSATMVLPEMNSVSAPSTVQYVNTSTFRNAIIPVMPPITP